ncbi:MAG: TIGR00725 family protein [Chloroflexi bacterium]|nr:TIGR00725 family protein [Chloroflexota bacterium]
MTNPPTNTSHPSDASERPLLISVIGGGAPSTRAYELAEAVGRELAQRGAVVVCGGLGGVMEAACRGAKSAGGVTIGMMPGSDPRAANPWVDYPVMTGMGYARNVIVVKTGRAAIAVDGAYGTLSEIAHALGDGTPVIGLETWELASGDGYPLEIERADSPTDAVEKAIAAAHERDARERAAAH